MSELVILGNGFDLAVGMKTKYSDFFAFYEQKTLDAYTAFSGISSPDVKVFKEWELQYSEITYWDVVFQIAHNRAVKTEEWNNVESVLQTLVKTVGQGNWQGHYYLAASFPVNQKYYGSSREVDDRVALSNFCSFHEYLFKRKSEQKIFDFLLMELNRFEKKFADYVKSEDYYDVNRLTLAHDLLEGILEVSPKALASRLIIIDFLSFNYTTSLLKSLVDINISSKKIDFLHIHGKAKEKAVIFGIDENKNRLEDPYYPFTKTSRLMYSKHNNSNRRKVLHSDSTAIRFYGHSISEFDYSYFHSIFDFLDIYERPVDLKFFYSIYCTDKEEEIKKEHIDSVKLLLKKYGETMDNKDHGKNLLHKLLLEGRLKIIKLPKDPDDEKEE